VDSALSTDRVLRARGCVRRVLDRGLPVVEVFPVREESQGHLVMFYVPFAISALCFVAIAVLVLRDC
jgi:hypothetical protein